MGIPNFGTFNSQDFNSCDEHQVHAELTNPNSELFKALSSAFMRAVTCGQETGLDSNTDEDKVFEKTSNQSNLMKEDPDRVSHDSQVSTGYRLVDAGMDEFPSFSEDAVTTVYSNSDVIESSGRPVSGGENGRHASVGRAVVANVNDLSAQEEECLYVDTDRGPVRRELVDIKSSLDLILQTPRDFWFHKGGDDQAAQTVRGVTNLSKGGHVLRAPDDGYGYVLVGPYTRVRVQDVLVKPMANHTVVKFTGTVFLDVESWLSEAYVSDKAFGGLGDAGFAFFPDEEKWYSDVDWYLVQSYINLESRRNTGSSADRPCRNCGSETISADCIDCGITYWDNTNGFSTNAGEFFTASRMDGFQVPFTVSNCHFLEVQPLCVFQDKVRVGALEAPATWTDSRVWNYEIFSRYVERQRGEVGSHKLVDV